MVTLMNKSLNIAKELCAVISTWIVHNYVVLCCQGTAFICPAIVVISDYFHLMTLPLATPTIPPTYGQATKLATTVTKGKSHLTLRNSLITYTYNNNK